MAGDAVLTRDGPVGVPLDYVVPQSGELLPLTVRATIDGSAAPVAFYATVQVLAPSGRIMGSYISSSIAAGGSADVTWFPHVGGQTGGVTPTSSVSWIHLHDISITVPSGPGSTIYDFTAAAVYTNDSSTFTVVAGNGVTINAVGFYVATISCDWNGAISMSPCEMTWNMEALDNGMFDQDYFGKPGFAGGVAVTQATQGFPVGPGEVGTASPLSLKQTTGVDAGVSMEAMIVRVTADNGDFT